MKTKQFVTFFFLSVGLSVLFCFSGCSTTDDIHNKKHLDVMEKDVEAMHGDVDRLLGLDKPSTLVED